VRSWRQSCVRSDDGKHHWLPANRNQVLRRSYGMNFKRKILVKVEFRVQCMFCMFVTRATIDFEKKEVRVKA
jgi:hypothetical protein